MMPKAKPLPPLELVEQLLDYDPETGVLKWKNPRPPAVAGIEAGTIFSIKGKGTKQYKGVKIKEKYYFSHRLAWLLQTGIDPVGWFIDHIDGNGLNNRFANLRIGTAFDNGQNRGASKNNSSGFKGVSFHKLTGKWQAAIGCNNKKKYLGLFPTPELAHMAYCKAAAELHGKFARAA